MKISIIKLACVALFVSGCGAGLEEDSTPESDALTGLPALSPLGTVAPSKTAKIADALTSSGGVQTKIYLEPIPAGRVDKRYQLKVKKGERITFAASAYAPVRLYSTGGRAETFNATNYDFRSVGLSDTADCASGCLAQISLEVLIGGEQSFAIYAAPGTFISTAQVTLQP